MLPYMLRDFYVLINCYCVVCFSLEKYHEEPLPSKIVLWCKELLHGSKSSRNLVHAHGTKHPLRGT